FEQRLRALLDGGEDRRPVRRSWKAACSIVLLMVAAPLTVVRLRPATANAQATASPAASQPTQPTSDSPLLATLGDKRFHDASVIRLMSLSPDGSRAISQSQEDRVVVWNAVTGDALQSFDEPRFQAVQVVTPALLRDNQTAVVPLKDNALTILDLQGKR